MTDGDDCIIIHKNRKRALWSLVIVVFFVPISAWLVVLGLQPGRPEIAWVLVLIGAIGVVAFLGSAIRIIHTTRAPWRLEACPSCLALYSPTYDLKVPWDSIAGIAVDDVNRRPGCVMVFEDVAAVVQRAAFHGDSNRRDAVTDAATMQARMEENFAACGYHLAIPGRILEMGPDELAELLTRARMGQLWKEWEGQP